MKLQPRPAVACLLAAVLAFLLTPMFAGRAGADPHAVQIEEVMAGAFGRPDLQFVELGLSSCQADLDGARLAFFDADGDPVGIFGFPAGLPNICTPSVLIATQAYVDLPLPDPSLVMPPSLVPGSGKVCFQNPTAVPPVNLCLSYGDFTGDSGQGSPGNAPALVPTRTCSLRRLALSDWFGNPNFNEDFGLADPRPGQSWPLNVPPRFNDVPFTSPFALSVEALFNAGVTGGCGNGAFCPGQAVTREQMAVLLLRSLEGSAFVPPACASPAFGDVPCSSPFARWINELAARGITGGCGGGNFCPGAAVSREQMAVFLLLAQEGTGFTPPACASPVFGDVPCSSPFAPWVNELAARGITGGCGDGTTFCPGSPVTREQMAAFLTAGFGLPVPSFDCSDGPPPAGEDDHGDTPATATPVVSGVPVAGRFETFQDRDVFSFEALAGKLYFAEAPHAGGSQSADILVLDAAGQGLGGNIPGRFNRATFRPAADGTVFIGVSASLPNAQYQLLVQGPVDDDHGGGRATATPLPLNVPTAGEAEEIFDEDFFAFEVEAGRAYVFEVTAASPFVPQVEITDAAGQLIAEEGSEFAAVATTTAVFHAPLTGTLFAKVQSTILFEFGVGGPGPYEVVVRGPFTDGQGGTAATAGPLLPGVPVETQNPAGDVDVFSFNAEAGETYFVEVAGLSSNDSRTLELLDTDGTTVLGATTFGARRRDGIALTPALGGTFFARVSNGPSAYRITLHGPLADDHGDTPAAATPLPGDATDIPGNLELPGDVDVFSFAVTAQDVFLVELTEFLPDHLVQLRVVDAGGNTVASNFRSALIKPEVSGALFVEVAGLSGLSNTGAYRIRVRPLADDHGDWTAEATLATPGGPAIPGTIDFWQDWDFFAFDAVAGEVLTIRAPVLPGQALVSIRLLDTDGETPLGSPQVAPVRFRAPAAGRYFLRVGGSLGVTYNLSIGPGVTP